MAIQPITDEQGRVVDEYDDGTAESTNRSVVSTLSPPPVATEPEASTQAEAPKENPTEFDLSDISIQIMLHHADDHPQGRLVSVIIHNFSGTPVIGTFREAELTEKSRLDSIHKAIYPPMQRFLLDLSSREQKKLQEAASPRVNPTQSKTVVPPASTQSAALTKTPTTTLPSSSETKSSPPSSAQTKVVSKEKTSKKGRQETKYQAIPMF